MCHSWASQNVKHSSASTVRTSHMFVNNIMWRPAVRPMAYADGLTMSILSRTQSVRAPHPTQPSFHACSCHHCLCFIDVAMGERQFVGASCPIQHTHKCSTACMYILKHQTNITCDFPCKCLPPLAPIQTAILEGKAAEQHNNWQHHPAHICSYRHTGMGNTSQHASMQQATVTILWSLSCPCLNDHSLFSCSWIMLSWLYLYCPFNIGVVHARWPPTIHVFHSCYIKAHAKFKYYSVIYNTVEHIRFCLNRNAEHLITHVIYN